MARSKAQPEQLKAAALRNWAITEEQYAVFFRGDGPVGIKALLKQVKLSSQLDWTRSQELLKIAHQKRLTPATRSNRRRDAGKWTLFEFDDVFRSLRDANVVSEEDPAADNAHDNLTDNDDTDNEVGRGDEDDLQSPQTLEKRKRASSDDGKRSPRAGGPSTPQRPSPRRSVSPVALIGSTGSFLGTPGEFYLPPPETPPRPDFFGTDTPILRESPAQIATPSRHRALQPDTISTPRSLCRPVKPTGNITQSTFPPAPQQGLATEHPVTMSADCLWDPTGLVRGATIDQVLRMLANARPNRIFVGDTSGEPPHRLKTLEALRSEDTLLVILPLHLDAGHWLLATLSVQYRLPVLNIYDSLSGPAHLSQAQAKATSFLDALDLPEEKWPLKGAGSGSISCTYLPPQLNDHDSGVAVCVAALYAILGLQLPCTTNYAIWRDLFAVLIDGTWRDDALDRVCPTAYGPVRIVNCPERPRDCPQDATSQEIAAHIQECQEYIRRLQEATRTAQKRHRTLQQDNLTILRQAQAAFSALACVTSSQYYTANDGVMTDDDASNDLESPAALYVHTTRVLKLVSRNIAKLQALL
jgi:hypothetical protein